MLAVPLLRRRIRLHGCVRDVALVGRHYTSGGKGRTPNGRAKKKAKGEAVKVDSEQAVPEKVVEKSSEPSLYEQLFPDQHEAASKSQRESEIPRLPIQTAVPKRQDFRSVKITKANDDDLPRSYASRRLRDEMIDQGAQTSVLVLRNAGKNLVEEDFKRLIPQGKHLEGWKLEQGDILRVIPGRDLETLDRTGYYYLLFSSALSAFTYQAHATRIHRMVAAHTPASILSAIPPPPGYMIEGMDAHAAIESFTLTPPTQSLDLRQLRPPLSPMVDSLVRNGGYVALTKRNDRMPYEARLTLEGPQLHKSAIRHILLASASHRGLNWSGGDDLAPRLTKWEPPPMHEVPSPSRKSSDTERHIQAQETRSEFEWSDSGEIDKSQDDQQKKRTPLVVYIAGFRTERAMQSFVHSWHRRPMEWETVKTRQGLEEEDLPPIANVEVLW